MQFTDLKLIDPLLKAIAEEGYTEPTPVQVQAIPHVLSGRDLLGIAQTGTGKTAAFALPILQRLTLEKPPEGRRPVRVLVVTPTRELATQIGESFKTYGRHLPFRHTVIFGGVGQWPQKDALQRGVDIVIATPGRLLDLMKQRIVNLEKLHVFVLDEADRMLDMGFLPDVRRIIAALPKRRQTLFFSATMPPDAQALADRILVDAARVSVTPSATTVEKVSQAVYFVERSDKQSLLEHLLADSTITRALVFTRTKHGANKVVQRLYKAGIDADAIHANKSQRQRERALGEFKAGTTRVLVATDIAARGIDVDDISHVVNFDLPNVPESYVHRIGRTARAGSKGAAIAFCDREERAFLSGIEKEIRMRIPVVDEHPFRKSAPRGHVLPHAVASNGAPPAHASNGHAPHASHAPAPRSHAPQGTGPRYGHANPAGRPPSRYGRAGHASPSSSHGPGGQGGHASRPSHHAAPHSKFSHPKTSHPSSSHPSAPRPNSSRPTGSHPSASRPSTSHPASSHPRQPHEGAPEAHGGWVVRGRYPHGRR